MVVGCPKCKAKLKIPDEKIKPEGTKFKCPKCQAMLLVKRPAAKAAPPPPPPPPKPEAPAKAPSPFEASYTETPSQRPSQRMEWPAPPEEEEPLAKREPWPEMPEEPEVPPPPSEEEPAPEAPPSPPFEEEFTPEAPPPPFEEEPAPEAPPSPPFEEEFTPEAPPPPFEEEPAPEAPPPPFKATQAPPKMEPVMEAPALPTTPPEEVAAERKAPPGKEAEAEPEARKVLLAHPSPQTVNMLKFVLMGANFAVTSATDGVQAMVKALKELPAVIVADVRLPKIHGIEMMKRLRSRAETRDIGIILTGSKPESEVPLIPGAAGYIQEDRMQQGLVSLIKKALAAPPAPPAVAPAAAKPAAEATRPAAPPADAGVQRAQRFARTVLSDIDLYNKDKVEQSIRQGSFASVFAKELHEGRKLYEMRIAEDVRSKGNFFDEAVRAFIEKKKGQFGI